MALPRPQVPDLQQPGNYIDLDQLGADELLTLISYPGIKAGDYLYPNWRGCSATGEVSDYSNSLIEIPPFPPEEGVPVSIPNSTLQILDQGWVFYSYQIADSSDPDVLGEESLRLFFNVGKRPVSTGGLGAPQCRESHDLKLDPELLDKVSELLIVTPPYRAMRAGDKVTLTLELYFDENDPWQSLIQSQTLDASDAGQPLQWKIQSTDFMFIVGGFALMHYSIEYAEPASLTESVTQTLHVTQPSADLLPALRIKDLSGGSLDPAAFPEGLVLLIEPWPGMQINDDVVLYVKSAKRIQQVVQALRADKSTLDSGVVQFRLDRAWLLDNVDQDVEFVYQYARQGVAGSSLPRNVLLRRPLDLPPPDIEGALIESPNEAGVIGYMFADQMVNGVRVRIPAGAQTGPGNKLQMHWDGYGSTGRFVAYPSASDPLLFEIPPEAVPANMGKRVDVYYKVFSPSSDPLGTSAVFDLDVRGIREGWPVIQMVRPLVTDGVLALNTVPAEGAGLDLPSWTYMAPRQRVRIKVAGLLQSGTEQMIGLRTGAAEPLTAAEYQAEKVSVNIPRDFLERLCRGTRTNTITVDVSFDDGNSYTQFPPVLFALVD
ncbi:hypothetical protein BW686_11830 [Pseudomonas syringae]|uniref:Uncharacterized protein n=1 Tax=Pseudomonas syringae TaxID=317 RepID=A0A244ERG2_PSESX|nr:hypothetical protein [Pseudomonas syringae]OUM07095.1 hypothetical protein BW686_11830 [Pseudomonas syringae]